MSVGVIGGPCENGVTGNHRSMGEVSKGVEVFFSSGFPEEQNQYLIPGFFTDALTVGENVLGIPAACVLTDGGIGFGGLLHIAIADKWIEILKERDKDGKMEDGVNTLTTRRWMKKCATYVDSNDHALGGEGVVLFWGALAKKLVEDDPQTNAMEGSDPRHGHPCVNTSTMICRGETIRSQVPPKEREISWERSHIRPGREIYLFISNCAYHSFTNSVGALAGDCRGCWDESCTNIKVSTNEVIPLSIVQKRYGIHMVSSQKVDAELVVKDGSLVNCEIKSGSQHVGVESPEMRYVVILDLPREPACILPAEDRVLRQGKENAFKISIFCAKDTSDEVSWQNLNKSLHRVSSGVNGKYEAVQEIEVDIVYHLERTVGSEEKLYRRKNGDSLSHATENKELNKRMTKGNQEQNESYAYPSFSPANNLEQATTDTNHCDCLMAEALNPNGKVFPLHVIKLKYWEGRGARMKLNSIAIFLLPP
ncbi:unnamed protein product [Cuscuta epithymum]|uniref:Uncharacterized protein n=1 Tax=Cuscuta epithymum TaxID=186058 RepID=A0AAV0E7V7_9ASTE|nr:unnamed protein product [Cuscuta epithymum]